VTNFEYLLLILLFITRYLYIMTVSGTSLPCIVAHVCWFSKSHSTALNYAEVTDLQGRHFQYQACMSPLLSTLTVLRSLGTTGKW